MAQQLSVLVVVDVKAARRTGSADGACYVFDNNRFGGSTGQGTPHMTTALVSAQVLNWAAVPLAILDPDEPLPVITAIGGEAVEERIMVPTEYDSPDLYSEGRYWSGTIIPGRAGTFPYTLRIEWLAQSGEGGPEPPPPLTVTSSIQVLSNEQLSTPRGARRLAVASAGMRP